MRTHLTYNSLKSFFVGMLVSTFALLPQHASATLSGLQSEAPQRSALTAWQSWPVVGEAQLSFLFFDVYRSKLRTPSGEYKITGDVTPHPLALQIRYQRDISGEKLVEETINQWVKQGVDRVSANRWGQQLTKVFPSVAKDDQLLFVSDGQLGEFYFSRQDQPFASIGSISDEKFADAFVAIWLSKDTEYPKHRLALIGKD